MTPRFSQKQTFSLLTLGTGSYINRWGSPGFKHYLLLKPKDFVNSTYFLIKTVTYSKISNKNTTKKAQSAWTQPKNYHIGGG